MADGPPKVLFPAENHCSRLQKLCLEADGPQQVCSRLRKFGLGAFAREKLLGAVGAVVVVGEDYTSYNLTFRSYLGPIASLTGGSVR